MYGRGTPSVAEQIHCSVEEAQKIIDDFFESYPLIKNYTEEQQKLAKQRGYTVTAWGRRRYINHIQSDKYEYKYNERRPVDFNPLFTAKTIAQKEVSQDIKDLYNAKLNESNSYQRRKIIEQAKQEGIDIIDNSGYLAEAGRQVLNSIIQRKRG
jgi:DNA polymerase-1